MLRRVMLCLLVGPRSSQHGKQLSSSLPVQQIHQGLLGDRHKAHSTSGTFSKPILPPGNSSNVSLSDIPNPQKNATGVPAAVLSSSSGFLHSSRAITSSMQHSSTTGFGSALNIETLVAAAERRDTSIEVCRPMKTNSELSHQFEFNSSKLEIYVTGRNRFLKCNLVKFNSLLLW
ncbi:unnamed protein product [Camellia sinensis]